MKKWPLAVGGAAVLAVVGVGGFTAACSTPTKTDAPEPAPKNIVDGTNTHVIRMPDGFRNIAFTCYGTTGIYVTSRGIWQSGNADATTLPSSISTEVNDPNCGATK